MDNGVLKVVVSMNKRKTVSFFKGTIVEMSDTSARKYIERGWAEEVKDDESTEQQGEAA